MKNKMGKNTKSKILDAAQAVFNQKGFENTSVEEISELAGVTKMMVYYHFESKEKLMIELVKNFLTLVRGEVHQKIESGVMGDAGLMRDHYTNMINFWSANEKIVTYILFNAIKDPSVFKLLQDVLKPFYDELAKSGQENSSQKQGNHFELFFFNTIPMIMFSIYKNNYLDAYGMDGDKLNDAFINVFINVLANNIKS